MNADLAAILEARELPPVVVQLTTGSTVQIASYLRSDRRDTDPIQRTACCWAPNKPTLVLGEVRTWAEFVIVRLLEAAGWGAVWVKNWGTGPEFCSDVGVIGSLPRTTEDLFAAVHARATTLRGAGTWDVLAWKGDDHLFIESKKHRSGDALRPTQIGFLEAALAHGLAPTDFAIVEYEAIA